MRVLLLGLLLILLSGACSAEEPGYRGNIGILYQGNQKESMGLSRPGDLVLDSKNKNLWTLDREDGYLVELDRWKGKVSRRFKVEGLERVDSKIILRLFEYLDHKWVIWCPDKGGVWIYDTVKKKTLKLENRSWLKDMWVDSKSGEFVLLKKTGEIKRSKLKNGKFYGKELPFIEGVMAVAFLNGKTVALATGKKKNTLRLATIGRLKGKAVWAVQDRTTDNLNLIESVKNGVTWLKTASYDDGVLRIFVVIDGSPVGMLDLVGPYGYMRVVSTMNNYGWPLKLSKVARTFYSEPRGIAIDSEHRVCYVSDPKNRRITWFKEYEFALGKFGSGPENFRADFAYAKKALPGVNRIWSYGASTVFFSHAMGKNGQAITRVTANGKATVNPGNKGQAIIKRTESFLNMLCLANGFSGGVEIIFDGDAIKGPGFGSDPIARFLRRFSKSGDFENVKAIMLPLAYRELFYTFFAYLTNPLDNDGIPKNEKDAEFSLALNPEEKYKGLAKEIYMEIADNRAFYEPDLVVDDNGLIRFDRLKSDVYRFFSKPEFADLVSRATARCLTVGKKRLEKKFPDMPLIVVIYPSRNFLGYQENNMQYRFSGMKDLPTYDTKQLVDQMRSGGIEVFDYTKHFLNHSLGFYPLYGPDDHFGPHGVDFASTLTANSLFKYFKNKGWLGAQKAVSP